jgi:hypothetical protein
MLAKPSGCRMSDPNNKAMVPQQLCPACQKPMKIRASLPVENPPGMRELHYICEACHATAIIVRRADPE